MWSVIRARQGVPLEPHTDPNPEADAVPCFERNNRHLSRFSNRYNVVERDPALLTPAYGEGLYRKLVEHLKPAAMLLHRQKAIHSIAELFGQNKEHIVKCVSPQIDLFLHLSTYALVDEDASIRARAYGVLGQAWKVPAARIASVGVEASGYKGLFGWLQTVAAGVSDADPSVRMAALSSLLVLLRHDRAAADAVGRDCADCVIQVCNKLFMPKHWDVQGQCMILGCAHCLLLNRSAGTAPWVRDFVGTLLSLLSSEIHRLDPTVIARIAQCLVAYSILEDGRSHLVSARALPTVLGLATGLPPSADRMTAQSIIEHVAATVAFMTLLVEGKKQALAAATALQQAVDVLLGEMATSSAVVNGCRLLSNLCEDPALRQMLAEHTTERIQTLFDSARQSDVKAALAAALASLRWTP